MLPSVIKKHTKQCHKLQLFQLGYPSGFVFIFKETSKILLIKKTPMVRKYLLLEEKGAQHWSVGLALMKAALLL